MCPIVSLTDPQKSADRAKKEKKKQEKCERTISERESARESGRERERPDRSRSRFIVDSTGNEEDVVSRDAIFASMSTRSELRAHGRK